MRILLVSKDSNYNRVPYKASGAAFEKHCEKFPVVYEKISRTFTETIHSDYFVPARDVPGGTYYRRVTEDIPNPDIEEWKERYAGHTIEEEFLTRPPRVKIKIYEETEGLFLSEMGFEEFIKYCLAHVYGIESPDGEFKDVDACLIVEDDS